MYKLTTRGNWDNKAYVDGLIKIYDTSNKVEVDHPSSLISLSESGKEQNHLPDILMTYSNTRYQDDSNQKKPIKGILPGADQNGHDFSDDHYSCSIKNKSHRFPNAHQIEWQKSDGTAYGEDTCSLTKQIKGCSDTEALTFVAETFGEDFSRKRVQQYQGDSNYTFIPASHTYECNNSDLANTILSISDQLMDRQEKPYVFKTENRQFSFSLLWWKHRRHNDQSFYLFLTLQKNKQTGKMAFEFIAPPSGKMIYNRHLMDADSTKEIHIHDNIENVDASNTSTTIGTWAGYIALALTLNWSFLKARKVTYFFDRNNLYSFIIGSHLIKLFREMGTDLELRERNRVVIRTRRPVTEEEFYKLAKDLHGLDLKSKCKSKSHYSQTLRGINRSPRKKQSFIVEPLFELGQFIIFAGRQKSGKSFVLLDSLLAIASGGKMGNRFTVKKEQKVLLIDWEMPEGKTRERFDDMITLYQNHEILKDNLSMIWLREIGQSVDLSTKEGQDWVENELRVTNAKVLALDNLGGMISDGSERNESVWRKVHKWIRTLNTRGIAVILVHHKNKKGEVSGTSKILNDVDLSISLQRPEGWKQVDGNIVEFHFADVRFLAGDQVTPFSIKYHTEDGVFKRDIEALGEDDDYSQPESLLSEEEMQWHEVEVAILSAARTIARNLDLKPEDRYIQKKDIKDLFPELSGTNWSDHFNKLCNVPLLSKVGYGKGTKYYLYPGPEKDTEAM